MEYICFHAEMFTGIAAKAFNCTNNSVFGQIFNPHSADSVQLFFSFFAINPNK